VTHSYIVNQQKFTLALTDPFKKEGYYFIEFRTTGNSHNVTFVDLPLRVVDLQFYLTDVLSILLDMAPDLNAGFAQVRK